MVILLPVLSLLFAQTRLMVTLSKPSGGIAPEDTCRKRSVTETK